MRRKEKRKGICHYDAAEEFGFPQLFTALRSSALTSSVISLTCYVINSDVAPKLFSQPTIALGVLLCKGPEGQLNKAKVPDLGRTSYQNIFLNLKLVRLAGQL